MITQSIFAENVVQFIDDQIRIRQGANGRVVHKHRSRNVETFECCEQNNPVVLQQKLTNFLWIGRAPNASITINQQGLVIISQE